MMSGVERERGEEREGRGGEKERLTGRMWV